MGFVHPAKTDLFVSYSHVDDLSLEPESPGWVTTLVKSLQNLLAQRLGPQSPSRCGWTINFRAMWS